MFFCMISSRVVRSITLSIYDERAVCLIKGLPRCCTTENEQMVWAWGSSTAVRFRMEEEQAKTNCARFVVISTWSNDFLSDFCNE